VDVYNSAHAADIIHVPADEFAEFADRVKAGEFDGLYPEPPQDGLPAPGPDL
jgi:hypothetical protein